MLGCNFLMCMWISVIVGEHSSVFSKKMPESDEEDDTRDEKGVAVFSSSWLPGSDSQYVNHLLSLFLSLSVSFLPGSLFFNSMWFYCYL